MKQVGAPTQAGGTASRRRACRRRTVVQATPPNCAANALTSGMEARQRGSGVRWHRAAAQRWAPPGAVMLVNAPCPHAGSVERREPTTMAGSIHLAALALLLPLLVMAPPVRHTVALMRVPLAADQTVMTGCDRLQRLHFSSSVTICGCNALTDWLGAHRLPIPTRQVRRRGSASAARTTSADGRWMCCQQALAMPRPSKHPASHSLHSSALRTVASESQSLLVFPS